MRHRKKNSSRFGLKTGPRKALIRGLVKALVERERIRTTLPKAKELKLVVEKAITLGRKETVHARRLLLARFPSKKTVSQIVKISERFKDRPGGYTRIIRLGNRKGDQASRALIEFVDYQFVPAPSDEEKTKRKASKEYTQSRRLLARKIDKEKKSYRKIQNESRRINR